MPHDLSALTPAVLTFLAGAHIARLATSDPDSGQPHVVAVWYEWDGSHIWISSFSGTRKIKELRRNPRYSLVIDIDQPVNQGVIFEGRAEILETDAQEGIRRGFQIYARYLGEDGAKGEEPQSWLHDPNHLLLRLSPDWLYVWGF